VALPSFSFPPVLSRLPPDARRCVNGQGEFSSHDFGPHYV
jgi:hypothetical protein